MEQLKADGWWASLLHGLLLPVALLHDTHVFDSLRLSVFLSGSLPFSSFFYLCSFFIHKLACTWREMSRESAWRTSRSSGSFWAIRNVENTSWNPTNSWRKNCAMETDFCDFCADFPEMSFWLSNVLSTWEVFPFVS